MTPLSFSKAPRKRNHAHVAPQLERNLQAYETASAGAPHPESKFVVIAATVAGLAALAIPGLADAEVVYTPTNQQLPNFGSLRVDLNNDGIADVALSGYIATHMGSGYDTFVGVVSARGLNGNGVEANGRNVLANPRGKLIGSSDNFAGNGLLASCTNHDGPHLHEHKVAGLWKGPQVHYMGVKFSISGETHYGWVRLRDFVCGLESPFMVGYAYETVANKPIQTGPPGTDEPTLGALAGGTKGLALWRKQPTESGQQ